MRQNKPEPPRNYSRSHATILMNVYFLEPTPKIEQIYYQCLQTKSSHGRRSISRRKPRQCTSRNIYWQSFNEDIISAARHLLTYTSLMVRWIGFGALDGPQTTEAPYETLLIDLHTGRTERYFGRNWSPSYRIVTLVI